MKYYIIAISAQRLHEKEANSFVFGSRKRGGVADHDECSTNDSTDSRRCECEVQSFNLGDGFTQPNNPFAELYAIVEDENP